MYDEETFKVASQCQNRFADFTADEDIESSLELFFIEKDF